MSLIAADRIPKGVFVAMPVWRETFIKAETRVCMDGYRNYSRNPKAKVRFAIQLQGRINAPFAINLLAENFDKHFPNFEWFLHFSDDQTLSIEDVLKLIKTADRFELDIIGGIVIRKEKDNPAILCGNFNAAGTAVTVWRRGIEITDLDVLAGRTKRVDAHGGACLIRRKVIEALRPERNNGLPWFSMDKWPLSYDWRIFQRTKEMGFKCGVRCDVLIGHVGFEGKPNPLTGVWVYDETRKVKIWNFYDSPVFAVGGDQHPDRSGETFTDDAEAKVEELAELTV